LNLLLVDLTSSEARTAKYLAEIKPDGDSVLVKHSYEELIAQFKFLQEATTNAIEEWQDIIPEANITTQVGMISKLKAELVEKCSDVQRAKNALADAQQASTGERQELENRLRNSQQELALTREQLINKENELSQCLGSLSGVIPGYSPETGLCQCPTCGAFYYPSDACPVCGAC
jgi:DNA repair exonuclease SbcCD ATPase subunit